MTEMCFVLDRDYTIRMGQLDWMVCTDSMLDDKRSCLVHQQFDCRVDRFEAVHLSEGAQLMMDSPNAGGTSEKSEAMSFELFRTFFGAKLNKTEMDIEYKWINTKKTDYTCTILRTVFAVSVTRAFKPAFMGEYTVEDATTLLKKKLYGVNQSTKVVCETDAWTKQILHVWAPSAPVADVIEEAYASIDSELKANTVVVVTVTNNADWIFRG